MRREIIEKTLKIIISQKDSIISLLKNINWKEILIRFKEVVKHIILSVKINFYFTKRIIFDYDKSEIDRIHDYQKIFYNMVVKKE